MLDTVSVACHSTLRDGRGADTLCDPASGSMPRWHVFQSEPSSEFHAQIMLRDIPGVEVWVPVEIRRRRKMRSGRPVLVNGRPVTEEVRRPYFTGYGLVRFCVSDPSWGAIRYTEGVKRLLCSPTGSPLPIADVHVDRLRAQGRAGDGAIDLQAMPFPLFPGQRVTVGGPFGDVLGMVAASDSARVTVLMGLLRVTVPRAQVVVA